MVTAWSWALPTPGTLHLVIMWAIATGPSIPNGAKASSPGFDKLVKSGAVPSTFPTVSKTFLYETLNAGVKKGRL
jgi:hypothetical protein